MKQACYDFLEDNKIELAFGESFCFIAGNEKPFDAFRLKRLYPDYKTYERKVIENVGKLVKERWITQPDGGELIAEAKSARIP